MRGATSTGWSGKAPFELRLKDARKQPAMRVTKGCIFRKERALSNGVGKEELGCYRTGKGTGGAGLLEGGQAGTRQGWTGSQGQVT